MRIRHKILVGYVALVSVAVALVVYFLFTLSDVNRRYQDVITRDLAILEQANNIRAAVQRQIVTARTYEQNGDSSYMIEYTQAVTQARESLVAIVPYLNRPENLQTIEEIRASSEEYSILAREAMTMSRQIVAQQAQGLRPDTTGLLLKRAQGDTARLNLNNTLDTFIARKNLDVDETLAAVNAKVDETSTYLLLWSMLGIIVTAIAGALLTETISAPLRRLMRNIRGISAGDLQTAIPVRSKDELGELAEVLETMRQRLASAAAENESLLLSAREEAEKLAQARHSLQVANEGLQAALSTESEARRRMVEIDKLKAEFTSMVSHELKTPVSYVYNYAGALKEHDSHLNESQRVEFLTAIQGEAQHLITLIDDIMAISLLEAGGLVHRFVETDLRKIVDSVVRDQQLTTRRHKIGVWGPDALPVRADPTRLRQVLNNLVSNAIKYAPQGGPIEVRLRANAPDQTAIVYVRDHGIGVDPADVPKLFDRFSRILSNDTMAIPGSGLGLYIAHHIMQAHGGTLYIQPAPGEGTIAEITVPLWKKPKPEEPHGASPEHSANGQNGYGANGHTVLTENVVVSPIPTDTIEGVDLTPAKGLPIIPRPIVTTAPLGADEDEVEGLDSPNIETREKEPVA